MGWEIHGKVSSSMRDGHPWKVSWYQIDKIKERCKKRHLQFPPWPHTSGASCGGDVRRSSIVDTMTRKRSDRSTTQETYTGTGDRGNSGSIDNVARNHTCKGDDQAEELE